MFTRHQQDIPKEIEGGDLGYGEDMEGLEGGVGDLGVPIMGNFIGQDGIDEQRLLEDGHLNLLQENQGSFDDSRDVLKSNSLMAMASSGSSDLFKNDKVFEVGGRMSELEGELDDDEGFLKEGMEEEMRF